MKGAHTITLLLLLLTFLLPGCETLLKSVPYRDDGTIVFEDTFDTDLRHWTIQSSEGNIFINGDGKLEIDVSKGATIWYNKRLTGDYCIEYEAIAVQKGGRNDRVSDLNCFWKAKDPNTPDNIFEKHRNGDFDKYDSMELYYAGIGVHDNSRTRFRRYNGQGNKPLLPEHDLYAKEYLLEPNIKYTIKIVVNKNRNLLYRDGKLFYDFKDTDPISEGWFAFRTFKSHLIIDNFKVTKL